MRNVSLTALALSAMLIFSGCSETADSAPVSSGEHPPVELSAWVAYWDAQSGMSEYDRIQKNLSSMACFGAYYDEDGDFFLPDEVESMIHEVKEENRLCYLTFVNDERKKDGKIVEKSTELLKLLFKDEESIAHQAEEMTELALSRGCDGVDLDYEAFWKKDRELIPRFVEFTKCLYETCEKKGLKLRVVLEPGADMDAGFCEGPEYVVMFYNLFGKHSEPGPKADEAFIQKTIKKMEALPGKKNAAFATGGCLWERDGILHPKFIKKQFLDEDEAIELCKKHKAKPMRDAKSAVLHYAFGKAGHETEVWYADSETLNAWITIAANAGITNVSIWRLGSNTDVEGIQR